MRVAYFANGPMFSDGSNNIYTMTFTDSFFQRYLCIGDEIEVCIRIKRTEHVDELTMVTMKNLTVTECPDFNKPYNIYKKAFAKKTVEEVVKRCDYIIARIPGSISRIAIDCCKKLGKKYLVEMVGCSWDSMWNHSLIGKVLAPKAYLTTKYYVKHAPAVIYVTNSFLQSRYPSNGLNVGCSDVELKECDPELLDRRLSKIRTGTNKIVIGTTAAVDVPFKGQKYVIKALSELKKKGEIDYEYQLVGKGDQAVLREYAKKCGVEDQVIFLGGLPHDEVFHWLEKIDIYAQPSMQEGLPRALVEAMSIGVPAFGANTGGIPELLDGDCVYKKGRGCIERIVKMIKSFDREKMTVQSRRNFRVAMNYQKDYLIKRRQNFYINFFKQQN